MFQLHRSVDDHGFARLSNHVPAGFLEPGRLIVVGGLPGGGKSLLAASLAARESRRSHVVVVGVLDPHDVVRGRLVAAGASIERIVFCEEYSLPSIMAAVVATEAAAVVVDDVMQVGLRPSGLRAVAAETSAAVVALANADPRQVRRGRPPTLPATLAESADGFWWVWQPRPGEHHLMRYPVPRPRRISAD